MKRALVATTVVALQLPSFAHADSASERADALIERGVELRTQRKDGEALKLFRQAYELRPTPRARAQMALAEQALRLWLEAEDHLEQALADGDDAWVTKNRAVLERAREIIRDHLGWVEVSVTPRDAVVRINDSVAEGPAPTRVLAGRVVVVAEAEGYVTERVRVTVAARATERVRIELERGPEGSCEINGCTGKLGVCDTDSGRCVACLDSEDCGQGFTCEDNACAAVLTCDTDSHGPCPKPPPERDAVATGSGPGALTWVALGVGVVGVGAGSYFGLRAFSKKSERDDNCAGSVCNDRGLAADEDGRDAGTLSTVSFAVGALGLGTALVLWLTADDPPPSAAIAPWLAPSPRGTAGGARFRF